MSTPIEAPAGGAGDGRAAASPATAERADDVPGTGADAGPGAEAATATETATATATAPGTAAVDGASTRPDPPPLDRLSAGDHRRLRRAWTLATVPVIAAYTWLITVGNGDLFQRQFFDDFFDEQARSLMHGRWDVPPDTVGFEGFLIHGKTYIYFGPIPSLLRMPVLLVTDRLDGRLTAVSMIIATAVLSVAAFRLTCALRPFVRGADPVGRREPLATAALAVAVLCGPPFFLASGAIVYNEAAIWGLALTVLALDAVLRWALRPTGWRLVAAAVTTTLAILSRQSLGLAPLAAMGLVCAWFTWRHVRAGTGPWRRRVDWQSVVVLATALAVPLLFVMGVNYAKFETLFAPPTDAHVESLKYEPRQEMLDANGGSLFGLQFVPTTLKQYLRPDGIDVRRDFPWVDFPRFGPSVVGDTEFDELDWTSSLPASAPALTVLAIAAAVWAWRHRKERHGPPWIAALCVGTLFGAVGVISLGYIANRYLNDLYPALVVPAIVGFHVVVARAGGWRRRRRLSVTSAVTLLVVFGAVVNLVLGLSYQREKGPVIPEEWRAQWVGWRLDLPGAYGPYLVDETWRVMPRHKDVFDGRLAIVGDCSGMYLERNHQWVGIVRGPRVDVYDVVVDLDDLPTDGSRVPLMTLGRARNASIVAMVRVDEDHVRVDIGRSPRFGSGWSQGPEFKASGDVTIRIDGDRREPPFSVSYGRVVLNSLSFDNDDRRDVLGQAPAGRGVATRFPGRLYIDTPDLSACRKALDMVEYDKSGNPILE
jgi:hypothetical protein